jgi:hypothetical protein
MQRNYNNLQLPAVCHGKNHLAARPTYSKDENNLQVV